MTDATPYPAGGQDPVPREEIHTAKGPTRGGAPPRAADDVAPCVLVVGMHRSGTSAVTAALAGLGLGLPEPADRMEGGGDNPRGHYESRSLVELNERILMRLGGAWHRPPRLVPGWEHHRALDDLVLQACEAFDATFGPAGRPVVWKDPRAALLLPFWRRVLERPIVGVLVVRDPLEVARSLATRDGFPLVRGLALYERYLRSALAGLEGLAVFVCRYEEALGDPTAFAKSVAHFLDATGVAVDTEQQLGPARVFDESLHHVHAEAEDVASFQLVLPAMRELDEALETLVGPHPCFAPAPLGPESEWTTALLDRERDLQHVLDGLVWATRQIEPILRATPRPEQAELRTEGQNEDDIEDAAEGAEPDENGPYPLNASEDRRAYHRWLRARRQPVIVGGVGEAPRRRARVRRALRLRTKPPLVSVLVPVWRPPLWALERCVGSVLDQTFGDWQLCICDDASGDEDLTAYLRSLRRVDRRINVTALEQNGGISAATNGALAIANGRFVAFLDHDDELTSDALEKVADVLGADPEVDVLYSDEDKVDAAGERFDPLFKPEWSPDLLLSFQYLGHLTVIRRGLVAELGGLRSDYDGSQDYDLALRATERARKIVHLPEVLYHWRTLPGSAASDSSGVLAKPWAYEAGLRAIQDTLARRGEEGEVTRRPDFPGRYHVRRKLRRDPLVSIIIPFRDEPALLATCAASLRQDPGYDRVELVLVDNDSELPETAELLDGLSREPDVTIVDAPGPFNWAAINNAAAANARGEILLFANNDIEARAPRWLHALLGHALRDEVGAVGARLLYPDGAIQHAGVVVGLGGIAGHVLRGLPGDHPGYNSMAISTRDCSVVTGACMMVRREVFESVGGFDERLPVAFNDVDFCLKLRERGYLVVYEPLAELIHPESKSRGHTDDLVEGRRIVHRWADVLAAGDPYLNVHLSHWRYWCPLSTVQEDDRWKTYLETSVLTRGSSSST